MDIHDVRQQLKKRSIFDIPLRVTYYARVSTDSDEQVNSLENQMTHYTEMITKNPRWTMVPGYIDEGISPPNAPVTLSGGWIYNRVAKKGVLVGGKSGSTPMKDTEALYNDFDYEIKER